jgi:hypothetical protein
VGDNRENFLSQECQSLQRYRPLTTELKEHSSRQDPPWPMESENKAQDLYRDWKTSKYEALSYVWGSQLSGRAIRVGGSKFTIIKNLYDALHYLRDEKGSLSVSNFFLLVWTVNTASLLEEHVLITAILALR